MEITVSLLNNIPVRDRTAAKEALLKLQLDNPGVATATLENQVLSAWSNVSDRDPIVTVDALVADLGFQESQEAPVQGVSAGSPMGGAGVTSVQEMSQRPPLHLGSGVDRQGASVENNTFGLTQATNFIFNNTVGAARENLNEMKMGRGRAIGPQQPPRSEGRGKGNDPNKNQALDFLESLSFNFLDSASVGLIGLLGSGIGKLTERNGGENVWTEGFLKGWHENETTAGKWGKGVGVIGGFVLPMGAAFAGAKGIKGATGLGKLAAKAPVHKVFSAPGQALTGLVTRKAKSRTGNALINQADDLLKNVKGVDNNLLKEARGILKQLGRETKSLNPFNKGIKGGIESAQHISKMSPSKVTSQLQKEMQTNIGNNFGIELRKRLTKSLGEEEAAAIDAITNSAVKKFMSLGDDGLSTGIAALGESGTLTRLITKTNKLGIIPAKLAQDVLEQSTAMAVHGSLVRLNNAFGLGGLDLTSERDWGKAVREATHGIPHDIKAGAIFAGGGIIPIKLLSPFWKKEASGFKTLEKLTGFGAKEWQHMGDEIDIGLQNIVKGVNRVPFKQILKESGPNPFSITKNLYKRLLPDYPALAKAGTAEADAQLIGLAQANVHNFKNYKFPSNQVVKSTDMTAMDQQIGMIKKLTKEGLNAKPGPYREAASRLDALNEARRDLAAMLDTQARKALLRLTNESKGAFAADFARAAVVGTNIAILNPEGIEMIRGVQRGDVHMSDFMTHLAFSYMAGSHPMFKYGAKGRRMDATEAENMTMTQRQYNIEMLRSELRGLGVGDTSFFLRPEHTSKSAKMYARGAYSKDLVGAAQVAANDYADKVETFRSLEGGPEPKPPKIREVNHWVKIRDRLRKEDKYTEEEVDARVSELAKETISNEEILDVATYLIEEGQRGTKFTESLEFLNDLDLNNRSALDVINDVDVYNSFGHIALGMKKLLIEREIIDQTPYTGKNLLNREVMAKATGTAHMETAVHMNEIAERSLSGLIKASQVSNDVVMRQYLTIGEGITPEMKAIVEKVNMLVDIGYRSQLYSHTKEKITLTAEDRALIEGTLTETVRLYEKDINELIGIKGKDKLTLNDYEIFHFIAETNNLAGDYLASDMFINRNPFIVGSEGKEIHAKFSISTLDELMTYSGLSGEHKGFNILLPLSKEAINKGDRGTVERIQNLQKVLRLLKPYKLSSAIQEQRGIEGERPEIGLKELEGLSVQHEVADAKGNKHKISFNQFLNEMAFDFNSRSMTDNMVRELITSKGLRINNMEWDIFLEAKKVGALLDTYEFGTVFSEMVSDKDFPVERTAGNLAEVLNAVIERSAMDKNAPLKRQLIEKELLEDFKPLMKKFMDVGLVDGFPPPVEVGDGTVRPRYESFLLGQKGQAALDSFRSLLQTYKLRKEGVYEDRLSELVGKLLQFEKSDLYKELGASKKIPGRDLSKFINVLVNLMSSQNIRKQAKATEIAIQAGFATDSRTGALTWIKPSAKQVLEGIERTQSMLAGDTMADVLGVQSARKTNAKEDAAEYSDLWRTNESEANASKFHTDFHINAEIRRFLIAKVRDKIGFEKLKLKDIKDPVTGKVVTKSYEQIVPMMRKFIEEEIRRDNELEETRLKKELYEVSDDRILGLYSAYAGKINIEKIVAGDFAGVVRDPVLGQPAGQTETATFHYEPTTTPRGVMIDFSRKAGLKFGLLDNTFKGVQFPKDLRGSDAAAMAELKAIINNLAAANVKALTVDAQNSLKAANRAVGERTITIRSGDLSNLFTFGLPTDMATSAKLYDHLKAISDNYSSLMEGTSTKPAEITSPEFTKGFEEFNEVVTSLNNAVKSKLYTNVDNVFSNSKKMERVLYLAMIESVLGKEGLIDVAKNMSKGEDTTGVLARIRQAHGNSTVPMLPHVVEASLKLNGIDVSKNRALDVAENGETGFKIMTYADESDPLVGDLGLSFMDGDMPMAQFMLDVIGSSFGFDPSQLQGSIKGNVYHRADSTLLLKTLFRADAKYEPWMKEHGIAAIVPESAAKFMFGHYKADPVAFTGEKQSIIDAVNNNAAPLGTNVRTVPFSAINFNKVMHTNRATIGMQMENNFGPGMSGDLYDSHFRKDADGLRKLFKQGSNLNDPETRMLWRSLLEQSLRKDLMSDELLTAQEVYELSGLELMMTSSDYFSPMDGPYRNYMFGMIKRKLINDKMFRGSTENGYQVVVAPDNQGVLHTHEGMAPFEAGDLEIQSGHIMAIKLRGTDSITRADRANQALFPRIKEDGKLSTNFRFRRERTNKDETIEDVPWMHTRLFPEKEIAGGEVDKGFIWNLLSEMSITPQGNHQSQIGKLMKRGSVSTELTADIISEAMNESLQNHDRSYDRNLLAKRLLDELSLDIRETEIVIREVRTALDLAVDKRTGTITQRSILELGSHLAGKYDYRLRREGSDVGKSDVTFGHTSMNQRYPSARPNDTLSTVMLGFLEKEMGGQVIINHKDAVFRSEADYDSDTFNTWYDFGDKMLGRSLSVRGAAGKLKENDAWKFGGNSYKSQSSDGKGFNILNPKHWDLYQRDQAISERMRGVIPKVDKTIMKMLEDDYSPEFEIAPGKFIKIKRIADSEGMLFDHHDNIMNSSRMQQVYVDSKKGFLTEAQRNLDAFSEIVKTRFKQFEYTERDASGNPINLSNRASELSPAAIEAMRIASMPIHKVHGLAQKSWEGSQSRSMTMRTLMGDASNYYDMMLKPNALPEASLTAHVKSYLGYAAERARRSDRPAEAEALEMMAKTLKFRVDPTQSSLGEKAVVDLMGFEHHLNKSTVNEFTNSQDKMIEKEAALSWSMLSDKSKSSESAYVADQIKMQGYNRRVTYDQIASLDRRLYGLRAQEANGSKTARYDIKDTEAKLSTARKKMDQIKNKQISDPDITVKFDPKTLERDYADALHATSTVQAYWLALSKYNMPESYYQAAMAEAHRLHSKWRQMLAVEYSQRKNVVSSKEAVVPNQRRIEMEKDVMSYMKQFGRLINKNGKPMGEDMMEQAGLLLMIPQADGQFKLGGNGPMVPHYSYSVNEALPLILRELPAFNKVSFAKGLGDSFGIVSSYMSGDVNSLGSILEHVKASRDVSRLRSSMVRKDWDRANNRLKYKLKQKRRYAEELGGKVSEISESPAGETRQNAVDTVLRELGEDTIARIVAQGTAYMQPTPYGDYKYMNRSRSTDVGNAGILTVKYERDKIRATQAEKGVEALSKELEFKHRKAGKDKDEAARLARAEAIKVTDTVNKKLIRILKDEVIGLSDMYRTRADKQNTLEFLEKKAILNRCKRRN